MAQKPVLGKGLASLLPGLPGHTDPLSSAGSAMLQGHSIQSGEGRSLGDSLEQRVEKRPEKKSEAQSFLGEKASTAPEVPIAGRERHLGISMAAIDEIHANHFQPRREFDEETLAELAQSIKTSGIIQPLVVRKSSSKDGFELIAGERRLRAAKMAGLKHLPIVIRKSTDREALELALIENIQRQNLNCIDEALAYFQLIQDFSLTQEEVAERVGKDRATVANYLRLLRLPEEIIDDLKNQVLSFGHGKALLGLEDTEMRLRARKQVIEKRMSVRDTEALVETMRSTVEASNHNELNAASPLKDPVLDRFNHLSRDLVRRWSAKVEIKGNENRGKIVIHYSSRLELDRILEDMQTDE